MSKYYITKSDNTRVPFEEGGMVRNVEVISANKTLTIEDSGKIFYVESNSITVELPSTVKGLEYTFTNLGADSNNNIRISPSTLDGISGTVNLASTIVVLSGDLNKDFVNIQATSISGDTSTILGTGVAGARAWLLSDSTGIWDSQGNYILTESGDNLVTEAGDKILIE